MMKFNDLDARVIKERIDMIQLWDAWTEAEDLRRHSFLGSMNWENRNGKQYLYSRKAKVVKSLGPRSPTTEKSFAAFTEGKRDNNDRLKTLKAEIEKQSSILRVLGAGRLPVTAARTLRTLRAHGKRTGIRVVGTNALYAYEAMAGVAFSSSSTATGDIDFLIDDRNRLKLLTDEGTRIGLARLIQAKVDRTFRSRRPGDYRLTNSHGYMIEFIRPQPVPIHRNMPGKDPLEKDDVEPAPIFGLQWLVNAPAVDVIVMDQRGFPAPMRCPDPRYWALHKAWLSEREDRPPDRRRRDWEQASLMMRLVRERLPHLRFDEDLLAGLPGELRRMIPETEPRTGSGPEEPAAFAFDMPNPGRPTSPFDE